MSQAFRSDPPFRAEHVGSLLRPPALRRAHRQFQAGEIDAAEFRAAQDAAVREAVALQEDLGFQAVGDGEFRRVSYWSHFVDAVDGLDVAPARFEFRDEAGEGTAFLAPRVTGKIRRVRSAAGSEFDFLKTVTTQTPKLTMPSPPTLHFWAEAGSAVRSGYSEDAEYFADLAQIYREEIADLAARGARYIQLDEVPLAMLCDSRQRERVTADGQDADVLVRNYVKLINDSLAGRPPDLTVGMHLCRGNYKGRWLSEGGYDAVAERLFADADVDVFFLEYDTPRAGEFTPLAALPASKSAVLGLVSTKTDVLEDQDDLCRRLDEASKYVPLERLGISPQCGFASTVAGNPITPGTQEAKLRIVRAVADQVWS